MTSPEPCARCGRDAELDIASLWLCMDCYHVAGSTCAGIGRVPATGTGSGVAATAAAGARGATAVAGARGAAAAAVQGAADQVC